jgi:hypothetical protein
MKECLVQTIQLTEQDSKRILLLKDKTAMLAEDYARVDQDSKKQLHQIVNEWVKIIEEQKDLGVFTLPDSLVSTYIKNQLRARKVSEGNINYVDDCIAPEYKDKRFLRKANSAVGLENSNTIEYLEDIYKDFISDDAFAKLSSAEKQSYVYGIDEKIKRVKKVCNDQLKRNEELAQMYKIPLYIKQTADKPPEYFWGPSQLHDKWTEFTKKVYTLYKYTDDITDLCWKFRPTGDVDQRAAKSFQEATQEFDKFQTFCIYVLEKYLVESVKIADEKNRETMSGWLNIGVDKFLNAGNHGAGVLNGVPIGKRIFKIIDNELYSVPLKRPFTKEIVGDNTKTKLVVEANTIIESDKYQQAIDIWVKETHCDQIITDPTKYMQERFKDPNIRVISGEEEQQN